MDDPFDEHSNKDTFFASVLTTFEAILTSAIQRYLTTFKVSNENGG